LFSDYKRDRSEVFLILSYHKIPYFGTPENRPWVLARGYIGASAFLAYVYAVISIPIGDAMAILGIFPVTSENSTTDSLPFHMVLTSGGALFQGKI
jgi:hypothetical protein